jgi:hypothetical protein
MLAFAGICSPLIAVLRGGYFSALQLRICRISCFRCERLKVPAGLLIGQKCPSISNDRDGATIEDPAKQPSLRPRQRVAFVLRHHQISILDKVKKGSSTSAWHFNRKLGKETYRAVPDRDWMAHSASPSTRRTAPRCQRGPKANRISLSKMSGAPPSPERIRLTARIPFNPISGPRFLSSRNREWR